MRRLKIVGILILFGAIGLYWFSPFAPKDGVYALEQNIEIRATPAQAFEYLGNSAHASNWSVFVHHIVPLNADQVKDGEVKSTRRCFKNVDETGIVWDEEIVEVKKNERRTLTIYNLQQFPWKTEGLVTRQLYEPSSQGVLLTFGLYKDSKKVTFWDSIKIRYTGYFISYVFKKNLRGIKRELEL